ncbi:hypothetical protein BDFG_01686 [Blastomyces dermatitidis ATCC 26199]|nr:hypothetical protein BDFG_01686 [Blastomyces dermatitidis ATCC 26199]
MSEKVRLPLSRSMSYAVYRVANLGAPRNHHTIFVETSEDGPETGCLFHVKGDIQNGMSFEDKTIRKPDALISLNMLPPKKQFHGPKILYPDEPLRWCQEWTAKVIEALTNAQVLQRPSLLKLLEWNPLFPQVAVEQGLAGWTVQKVLRRTSLQQVVLYHLDFEKQKKTLMLIKLRP